MKIIELLKKDKRLHGWKVVTYEKNKINLHYTKNFEEENYLEGFRKDVEVTIYISYGDQIGENTFPVINDDENYLKKQIDDAVYACSFTKKQKYELLKKKEKVPNIKLVDSQISEAIKNGKGHELLKKIAANLFSEFRKQANIKLNGMELSASKIIFNVLTSKNISVKTEKTELYVDAVITSFSGKKEQEYLGVEILSRVKDFDASKFVKKYCNFSQDILKAKSPDSCKGNIILTQDALHEFFFSHINPTPLILHASARLKHMGISRFNKGDFITINPPQGETITLISNPHINFNPASSQYDEDCVASKKIKIIENSRVKNFFGDLRHSQYIGIKPTGLLGVLEVSPGKKPESALLKEDHYEIVAFSWFNPNTLSGDFSAEIRLGYIVRNGKKIPFKGGTFTGNVFHLFRNVYLSKETELVYGYKGPKAILFKDAQCCC
ncbi:MAG: metallopeptidase TldD-related protein [Candidatus Woesearchaeota archaeon]